MKAKRKHLVIMLLVAGVLLVGLSGLEGCKKSGPKEAATMEHEHERETMADVETEAGALAESTKQIASVVEQTTCPVMDKAINKNMFTEYKGKKVYFCCPGCKEKFEKDPEKYIAKLPQFKN